MTNLVVPTFLWFGVPEHEISAVLISPEKRVTVTGSVNGQICLWDFDPSGVRPTSLHLIHAIVFLEFLVFLTNSLGSFELIHSFSILD